MGRSRREPPEVAANSSSSHHSGSHQVEMAEQLRQGKSSTQPATSEFDAV